MFYLHLKSNENDPLCKAIAGHLLHYVYGEILGHVLFASEIE